MAFQPSHPRCIQWFMVAFATFTILLSLCSNLSAQAKAVITAPETVAPGDLVILSSEGSTGTVFKWDLIGSNKTFLPVESNTKAVFATGTPGKYYFYLAVADTDETSGVSIDTALHTITIGKPDDDSDTDDGDEEDADTAPFPSEGLVVLIIHEKQTVGTLPEAQKAIFTSQRLQQFLSDNCLRIPPENQPGYRIWDDDYSTSQLRETPPVLRSAYQVGVTHFRDNNEVPWIILSNGKTGVSQPLPASVDDTLSLIQKYL
jgi:hypothetical protein